MRSAEQDARVGDKSLDMKTHHRASASFLVVLALAASACSRSQPADGGTDGGLGPPGPGTGGLPTEPNTETPASAARPDANEVNIDVYGLNGMWVDDNNGRDTCVIHTGSEVAGNYTVLRECDHQDGTGQVSTTMINFRAAPPDGGVIVGTTTTCKFGFSSGNGYVDAPMSLTISSDGKGLNGSWYSEVESKDIPFSLTRQTVGNCSP
jgi:hypothetical protein